MEFQLRKKSLVCKKKKKKNHDQMNGFLFFKLVSNTYKHA